jgi:hypothetical protein
MHAFGGTNDGVHRARLNAERTADTVGVDDAGNASRQFGWTTVRVDRLDALPEQGSEPNHAVVAARRAPIDRRQVIGQGLGVRPTAREAATAALGLWQDSIDGLDPFESHDALSGSIGAPGRSISVCERSGFGRHGRG